MAIAFEAVDVASAYRLDPPHGMADELSHYTNSTDLMLIEIDVCLAMSLRATESWLMSSSPKPLSCRRDSRPKPRSWRFASVGGQNFLLIRLSDP